MTSVYDALQRVRQGGGRAVPLPGDRAALGGEPAPRPFAQLQGARAPGPIAAELTPLLAAVRPLIDSRRGAVVHVVATAAGEGTSTIAREFALLAATTGRRRTLLLDGARGSLANARYFDCDTGRGLVDGIWMGSNEALEQPIPGTSLSVACLVGDRSNGVADPVTLAAVYDQLRHQFELIVVDCAAMERGEYASLLPEAADGILLVIRAEGTRPAVIGHAKSLVEQAGGRFLGAILNRRRNYIPDFLYRLL